MGEKIKSWLKANKEDVFLIFTIVAVALIGFALGRISALRENKFPIEVQSASIMSPPAGEKKDSKIVGSKDGTVYHLANCSGAKQIKEENKIYFSSQEEAQKAGYRPAANCPGL